MTHIEKNSIEKSPKMIPKKKSNFPISIPAKQKLTRSSTGQKINDTWRKFNVISNSYLIKKQSENKTKKNQLEIESK